MENQPRKNDKRSWNTLVKFATLLPAKEKIPPSSPEIRTRRNGKRRIKKQREHVRKALKGIKERWREMADDREKQSAEERIFLFIDSLIDRSLENIEQARIKWKIIYSNARLHELKTRANSLIERDGNMEKENEWTEKRKKREIKKNKRIYICAQNDLESIYPFVLARALACMTSTTFPWVPPHRYYRALH